MPAANVLCAAILGYQLFGMNGTCIAAVVAWALVVFGRSLEERQQSTQAAKVLNAIEELQRSLSTGMSNIVERLPATGDFYSALLDGTPVDDYRLLEMRNPRSAEEWDWPRVWPLIRRRLVHCYGLSPQKVDKAKDDLLSQHATQSPLPRSDKELQEMLRDWRAATQRASQIWAIKDRSARPNRLDQMPTED